MRVVVVGTGIAGLITAYRASANHDVVLVTKAELAESNTKYAQGGIAAAMFPDDSVDSHVEDTLVAGAGLCDRNAVEVLCGELHRNGAKRIVLVESYYRKNGESMAVFRASLCSVLVFTYHFFFLPRYSHMVLPWTSPPSFRAKLPRFRNAGSLRP